MRTLVRVGLRLMLGFTLLAGLALIVSIRPVDRSGHGGAAYAVGTFRRLADMPPAAGAGVAGEMRAGFGRARLTPELGAVVDRPEDGAFAALPLAGYGNRRGQSAIGVHDDLWVKAVAFAAGGTTGVLVSVDALIVPREVAAMALDRIRESAGLGSGQVYFGATHTHCGLGGWGEGPVAEAFAGGFRPGVREWMSRQLAAAAVAAVADLQPAAIGRASFEAPEFVRNRLVGDAGRVDAAFDLLLVRKAAGGLMGVVGSYAAHATVVSGGFMEFSAEYPGAWQRALESRGVAHAMFFAGAVGSHGPRAPKGGIEGAVSMGESLAERSLEALRGARIDPSPVWWTATLDLDLPPLQPRVSDGWAIRPWIARRLLPVGSTARVQAWRLGDAVWISTPCDYSGELALDLRSAGRDSGLEVVVTSFNGDYLGYVVPRQYYGMDAYETRTMAFFGPQLPEYLGEVLNGLLRKAATVSR